MIEHGPGFKRMLLGLPHSANDYASVEFAAELAGLLRLDLIGIFADDESLLQLAALPCVREFRLSNREWHRVDSNQLERGSNQALADARHLFLEAAKALHIAARFDHAKGPIGDAIGLRSNAEDIIAVIEPKNPVERVTHQFRQLMDAALAAPAAALLVPSRIGRRKGPVVAVATSQDDSSIQAALRLAKSIHERLLLVTPADIDEASLARWTGESGVPIDRRVVSGTELGASDMAAALGRTEERFLVLSRSGNRGLPSELGFVRRIPVLVTAQN